MALLEEEAERKKEKERYSLECSLDGSSQYMQINVRDQESQRIFENRFDRDTLIECGFMETQTIVQIKGLIESAMKRKNELLKYQIGYAPGRSGTIGMGYKGEGENYKNTDIKDTYAEGR